MFIYLVKLKLMKVLILNNPTIFYLISVVKPTFILVYVKINSTLNYKITFDLLGNFMTYVSDNKTSNSITRFTDKDQIIFDSKKQQVISISKNIDIKPIYKLLFVSL
uniref:Uncharacterized protein n=1 Tax=Beauveria bassiana TaxID=176275 RepID=A0A192S0R4_BEABA|nr:hypothetical protein [Beauveria bassiana]QCX41982.1 hypothetical protein [Beauveria bassiana]